ncbi:MAG TPA: metallophosphoesterase [Acidimicrobiales bacterium]|nr:metallophosphoesterase [Acidimicrobiales bacterium]
MDVPELTTVASTYAVVHHGTEVRRTDGLRPDTEHELEGIAFRTLPEPGELLATFATVNDVHFGEEVCGRMEGLDAGPVFRSEPGESPYPEVMNRGAVAEILELDPDALVVKGDLTSDGTDAQVDAFLAAYAPLADRMTWVRGNHESYHRLDRGAVPTQEVVLPGVRLALLDTSLEDVEHGGLSVDQLDWLDTLAAESDRPVVVLGHHHPWNPSSNQRPERYFGINPDDSERLIDVVARRSRIVAYLAGHTHRNRVRHFPATGPVPWVEVACVKDFPGAWAEYQVHEGGICQVFHRISSPEALAWSEKTRHMFADLYGPYAFGSLADRCFVIGLDRAAA